MVDEPASQETPARKGVAPYCLAMVICDAIVQDPGTGKVTLFGLFSAIGARQFPATHPALFVYIALTDGRGKTPVKLRLIDANEARPVLWEAENSVDFIDPRVVVEINFGLAGLTFPEPGEYRFQVFSGIEPVMERRILLYTIGSGQ